MKLKEFLADANKAVVAFGSVEALAVSLGLLNNAVAGYVTAGIGAVTSVLVYLAKNVPPVKP